MKGGRTAHDPDCPLPHMRGDAGADGRASTAHRTRNAFSHGGFEALDVLICDEWHTSPQTMNYALKTLEGKGFVSLELLPGGRHDKVVVLTQQGRALIDDVIEPLMRGERRAFHTLNETEQGQLLSLTDKLVSALRDALGPGDS